MGDETVRLTSYSHGAGCACKLSPADLHDVLAHAPALRAAAGDADLLVGMDTGDDAAVYRLDAERALVLTTDFFTPIVDDARDWGRIAAVNALSDVYAMGGNPLVALNLVAWPREALPFALLGEVLEGAADAVAAAGCLVVGGHSIDDAEPKFGLAVVGTVHPDHVLTNRGARPGDDLVLTKPLGIGAVTTGAKRGLADAALVAAAVDLMTTPNAGAAAAAREVGIGGDGPVHAGTDVTGFGLLGHLLEVVRAAGVGARVEAAAVPALDGAIALLEAGAVAGGTQRNHAWVAPRTDWGDTPTVLQHLLADAQTSGGLLLACAPGATDELVAALGRHGTPAAARIGSITDGPAGTIAVV
jgi:selenide,water dikinase